LSPEPAGSQPGASAGGTQSASLIASRAALRAGHFNRGRVGVRNGLIASVPVVAVLALGTALNQPAAAVTMAVGAVLVGMSWLAGDGPSQPPVGTMVADAVIVALATAGGTFAGNVHWLHLGVLVILCLLAGLGTTLGRRGAVVGTQAIIAYVILGAFPEPAPQALGLGGLALFGGGCQAGFCALLASPLAFTRQRAAVAGAYEQLAVQIASPRGPAVATGIALDSAELVVRTPALFADPELEMLAGLVSEGRRIRLQLAALAAGRSYVERTLPEAPDRQLESALERIAQALRQIAATLNGGRADAQALVSEIIGLGEWGIERGELAPPLIDQHIAALTGQASAAGRLALEAAGMIHEAAGVWRPAPDGGGGRWPRPSVGSAAQIYASVTADLRRIRDSARRDAPAGRHALRLAVVVAGVELLAQRTSLAHGAWAVMAAATVLRPGFEQTFTRGGERILGTGIGAVVATLIAVAIEPSGWGLVAVIGVLAYAMFTLFPASFTAGVAGFTAVVVFLLHAVSPDTTQLALDRGVDTLIGGAIGLAAYALWPTWSRRALPRLLSELIEAQRDYLAAVLGILVAGVAPHDDQLRPLARRARVAWGDAQAMLKVARSEPRHDAEVPRTAPAMLAALRRLVYGVHALRLAIAELEPRTPRPELAGLATALIEAVDALLQHARGTATLTPLPPLRSLYRRVSWHQQTPADLSPASAVGSDDGPDSVRIAIDELIDAINSLVASVGLELPTEH
jgi:hypothetical protein